jgi:hypothetical protein
MGPTGGPGRRKRFLAPAGLLHPSAAGAAADTADPVYGDSAAGRQVYFQVNTEDASLNLVPVSGTS